MAMRLSGLMSGMDTDSIVQELVAVRRTKVDTAVKAQTKLEWKQEAWKELNTKLKNLQSKFISNMRFSSAYAKKTSKVSDETVANVITGENAVKSVQTLQVKQLAKTAYLTGAEVETADGGKATALTKLSELKGWTDGASGTISLATGDKSIDIEVNGDTTISSILSQVKDAGLNASFDANNQRFFVSAKESGVAADFSFIANGEAGQAALQALGLQESLTWNDDPAKLSATMKEYVEWADYYVAGDAAASIAKMQSMIDATVETRKKAYLEEYNQLKDTVADAQKKIDEIIEKYGHTDDADAYEATLTDLETRIAAKEAELEALGEDADPAKKEKLEAELKALKDDEATLKSQSERITKAESRMEEIAGADGYITIADDGTATANSKLTEEVNQSYLDKATYAAKMVDAAKTGTATGGATKVNGQDAEIILNGASFKGSDNVFEINGLTITALNETKGDDIVTLTTQEDVDGIYDMVKNFLKEYNSIISEMDKLYNADSAKGFEPLTDEEKEAVSETEAEKYEKKIKDSLLRRDSNLNSVSSALKSAMSSGYSVNGKMMYLSDFGINTLGYFTAADNEKNMYHIDGDSDDASTSGNADKLKSLISSDPDTVISFFSALANNLYEKMDNMSRSVNGYRSFGSFYDDKKMKSDYSDYTSKIAKLEEKLADYEDSWYAKFSAMETAMAKMQSNATALTNMLGG